jgi:hypothetical protein
VAAAHPKEAVTPEGLKTGEIGRARNLEAGA